MSRRRTPLMATLSLAIGLSGLGLHVPARAETSDTLVAVSLLAGARFARWYWLLMNAGILAGFAFCVWLWYSAARWPVSSA